nr:hypothetical protein [Tanacetum cinerariifolium]
MHMHFFKLNATPNDDDESYDVELLDFVKDENEQSYESDDEDDSKPEVGNQNAKYGDENVESVIIHDAAKDDNAKEKDNNDDGDESDDEENSQVVRDVEEDKRNKVSDEKDNNDDEGGSNMEGAGKKVTKEHGSGKKDDKEEGSGKKRRGSNNKMREKKRQQIKNVKDKKFYE